MRLLVAVGLAATAGYAQREGGGYLGSQACKACHAVQYERQSASEHARALFRAAEHPLAGSFSTKGEVLRWPDFRFQFFLREGQLRVRATDGRDVADIPAEWAFGAGDQAVTFVTRVNEDWYLEHSFSYYLAKGALGPTPGQQDLKPEGLQAAMGLLYKTLDPDTGILGCFECHSTGPVAVGLDRTLRPFEPGVHCEACHGPGNQHARSPLANNIGNPKRLSARELNKFCGRCHRPPGPPDVRVDWNYSWNVRHQPVYLSESACFRKSSGALSCLTCHDPHDALRKNDETYYAAKCAACHHAGGRRPAAAVCGSAARENCVDCHMPRVTPQAYLRFTNHWIGVYGPGARLKPAR
jgi:hypothetical protein